MNLSVAYGTLVIHKYYYSFQMQKVMFRSLTGKKEKSKKNCHKKLNYDCKKKKKNLTKSEKDLGEQIK